MSRRGLIALVGAIALSLLLPPLFDGLPLRGQRALAVTLITVVLWTARGLDSGVTALLSIALLGLSGAGEIFRFGLWMTALGYVVILLVAVPY
jgi:hypothetical protein